MKKLGENALPNTERTLKMAEAEDRWQTLAVRAKAVGDLATAAAYQAVAYDESEKAAREYDDSPEFKDLDEISRRVMQSIMVIEAEAAHPRLATATDRLVMTPEATTGEFYKYFDGRYITPNKDNYGGAVRFDPDEDWQTVADKVVAIATNGHPDWQEEQVPDLRSWEEVAEIYLKRDKNFKTRKKDWGVKTYDDVRFIYNIYSREFAEYRDQFTVKRTPTTMGVDLLLVENEDGSRKFLIAQKSKEEPKREVSEVTEIAVDESPTTYLDLIDK